jgi:hypothetical protein
MPVHKFVVTNRILALCSFHFSAAQNSAAPAKMRREPFVRGRRFAAVDANAHLIPRRGVSPSCQKLPMVIKSLSVCPRGHPCCLGWADLAEGRLYLDHLPAMAVRRLSSPALARIPREPRKFPARHPSLALRP